MMTTSSPSSVKCPKDDGSNMADDHRRPQLLFDTPSSPVSSRPSSDGASTCEDGKKEKMRSRALRRSQIAALWWKNFLLARRSKVSVICEFIIPVIVSFAALLLVPIINSGTLQPITTPGQPYPFEFTVDYNSTTRETLPAVPAREGVNLYQKIAYDPLYNASAPDPKYHDRFTRINSLALYDFCFCKTLAIGPSGNKNAMEFAEYIREQFSEWDKYPARVKADSYAGILGYDDKNTTWTFPECKVLNEMESRPIVTTTLRDPDGVVRLVDYGSYSKTRVSQTDYQDRLCAYIDLEDLDEPIIRGNGTVKSKYSRYNTLWWGENEQIQRGDPNDNGPEYYADMGFAIIQAVLDDFKSGGNGTIYLGQFPMPYRAYKTVAAGEAFQGLASMFGVLFYMFPSFAVARKLIAERSGRLREGMRVMGLKDYPYIVSWYLWYFAFYFVIALIVFLFSLWMLPITGSLWLFLLAFLDQLSSMAFTFAVSTLFSSPNSGAVFTCAIYYIIAFTLALFGREQPLWGISLFPQCTFTMICNNIGYQFGIGITNISASVVNHGFNLTIGVVMLIVGFFVWTLVYLYLDQVIPHEYRATRKWYFPFQKSYWDEILGRDVTRKSRRSSSGDGDAEEVNPDEVSGIEKAWDQQQLELLREGQTVDVHDLKVRFKTPSGSINAVNGLDLEMFRDELFVLLGHNGAGKSTTINVLSGVVKPTSGDVRIFNHRVPDDMPLIRRSMGVCLQHNVLWGDLTVQEHLDLFARIRGLKTDGSKKLADEVGLGMKYNAKAKTLSGSGYNVTIAKTAESVPDEPILSCVDKCLGGDYPVTVVSSIGLELGLRIPFEAVNKFGPMFQSLDADKDTLGISSYGVSVTNLEEVFLKVSSKTENPTPEDVKAQRTKIHADIPVRRNIFNQFLILSLRRLIYGYRKWGATLAGFIIPFLVLLALLGLQKASLALKDPIPKVLGPTDSPYDLGPSTHVSGFWDYDRPQVLRTVYGDTEVITDLSKEKLSFFQFVECMHMQPWNQAICKAVTTFSRSLLGNNTATFDTTAYGITTRVVFADMTAMHMVPYAMATDQPNATIVNHPLPVTYGQKSADMVNLSMSFSLGGMFVIAFIIAASNMLSYAMMEKTSLVKEQLYVSGCNIVMYWISSWIYDFLTIFACAALCFSSIKIYGLDLFLHGRGSGGYLAALAGILFLCSLASTTAVGIGLVIGMIGSFVVAFLLYGGLRNPAGVPLMWVFRLVPSFPLANGITTMFFATLGMVRTPDGRSGVVVPPLTSVIGGNCVEGSTPGSQGYYCVAVAGDDIIMLFIMGVFYLVLAICLDYWLCNTRWNTKKDVVVPADKLGFEDHRMVYIRNLKKVFHQHNKKKQVWAVRGLNYALADGGIFGLLGVNGAGKTTTFKMLCVSQGNTDEARKNIGYCPQQDALIDGLTVQEHLTMYGVIRGVPLRMMKVHVKELMEILQLSRYAHSYATRLSGGNKRKLCVGMALIGHPSIVFLDEPTTGVDPEARRNIWNVINKIANGRSKRSAVILTTHSMEEADALCNEMVIQVDGQFRCLGTSQQIKSEYGAGYKLQVHFIPAPIRERTLTLRRISSAKKGDRSDYLMRTDDEIRELLEDNGVTDPSAINCVVLLGSPQPDGVRMFSGPTLAEGVHRAQVHERMLRWLQRNLGAGCASLDGFGEYSLPRELKLGEVFTRLTDTSVKQGLGYDDFQLTQATLEHVFNSFAKQSAAKDED
ncbi:hypothetical protein FOZ60_005798 [Perkinsus olseni]|uniref:ABC transporter domain-containing protein n=2 Tax=Perkinsus olseni TaxID=32597 RepID=A0A7J6PHU6_PEROL|nr:hypothetical protein FOZ60_005798 [Perkinsus olseni]